MNILGQETGGPLLTVLAIASMAIPTAVLLLGIRPSAWRAAGGVVVTGALQLPVIAGEPTGNVLASVFLIPVLVLLVVPSQRLAPPKSLLKRGIIVVSAGAILTITSAYIPYPLGWLVVVAPWLGLVGQRRPKRYAAGAVLIGLAYGVGLILIGPFTTAASFSGCCGIVALASLWFLGRTEASPDPSPYARTPKPSAQHLGKGSAHQTKNQA